MIPAAAYTRVSTDGQVGEDRFGLDAQRETVRTFAAGNGYEVVRWWSDEGFSGATMERPALQELLACAPDGEFKTLLVPRMDRVARDLYIQLWVERELARNGVELLSVGEPFTGQDPMTVAFRQMAGVFAELEKHRIRERMSGGRKQKARQGGYAGGGPPLGYTVVRGTKVLLVDETKAATVRRLFELRDQHPEWLQQDIADTLNAEGHTTAWGRPFHKVQVSRALAREDFYRGVYSYSGVEAPGRHEPILTSPQGGVTTAAKEVKG